MCNSTNNTIVKTDNRIIDFSKNIETNSVKNQIIKELKDPQKSIQSKYFYDKIGSDLFEQITRLEEYYPTRTEKSILKDIISKLDINFNELNIIELGSGDNSKIRLLLDKIPSQKIENITYTPVDISKSAIEKSIIELTDQYKLNDITGIVADFSHQLDKIPKSPNRLFCFFGSTIGNMDRHRQEEFINNLTATMNDGDSLLLGVDMVKETYVLEKAYNDNNGITAKFNKNILNAINKIANMNFNPNDFNHMAYFNKIEERIEMHLVAKKDVSIKIKSKLERISIRKGETIHTENSYKFTKEKIESLARNANLKIVDIHCDKQNHFNIIELKK